MYFLLGQGESPCPTRKYQKSALISAFVQINLGKHGSTFFQKSALIGTFIQFNQGTSPHFSRSIQAAILLRLERIRAESSV